jgi:hypothetical protein
MLTEPEMGAMLRGLLPLLQVPGRFSGTHLALCVDSPADVLAGSDGEVLGAAVDLEVVRHSPASVAVADAWLRGTVAAWLDVLFDRGEAELQTGGAPDLAEACVVSLRGAFSAGEQPEPALA